MSLLSRQDHDMALEAIDNYLQQLQDSCELEDSAEVREKIRQFATLRSWLRLKS